MERILVIAEKIFINLYRPGLEDYSKTHDDLTIDIYCLDVPKEELSTVDRLRYKLDIGGFRKKYYDAKRNELSSLVKEYDTVLCFNLFQDGQFFLQGEFEKILKEKNSLLYFVDSAKTLNIPCELIGAFKRVFVFEIQDVKYVKDTYGICPTLIDGGTSYYLFDSSIQKNTQCIYDLCFVGISTPKRLEYLDRIAEWCKKNNKSFFVAGHFWHTNSKFNYVLGKFKFKIKHPILAEYVQNRFIQPCYLAGVYAQSKIVLNINVAYHKSLNQRTFDIMYSNSMLICDEQDISNSLIVPNRDFVMCKDIDDMIEKIEYYLNNDEERKNIIKSGHVITEKNYLFKYTLDKLFSRGKEV